MKKTLTALAVIAQGVTQCALAQESQGEIITVIGSPLTQVDAERINTSSNTDADFGDQIEKLTGVSITRNGPVTGLVQYRGLYGDRVGITIDGVDIAGAGPNAMDSPLSHVLPEPGLQAVLYRGIVPVSACVQTLGGKLDIRANDSALFNLADGLKANFNGALFSPGTGQQYQANGVYRFESGFLTGAFTHQQRDEREAADDIAIPNSAYLRNGAKLRAGYEQGNHQFTASYQALNTNQSGTPALAMDINFIDAAWYRLGYRYQASDNTYFVLNAFGNSNQHAMDNFRQRPVMMDSMARQNDADAIAQGFNTSYVTPLYNGTITLGANVAHKRNNSTISNPNDASFYINNFASTEQDTYSLFSEWEGVRNTVQYQFGARFTQVNADANDVGSNMEMMNDAVASLAISFNGADRDKRFTMLDLAATLETAIGDNAMFFAGVSQKNRAPNYYELYTWLPLAITGGMADGFNYIGNTALEEETARQIEFGTTFSAKNWTISPRFFYQDIENYITGMPSENASAIMFSNMMSGTVPFQWANTDAVMKGVDITLHGELLDNLSLDMLASHTHGNRDDIDDALFRIAPERLVTRLQWQTALFASPLSLEATSELVGSQSHVSALQSETATAGYGLLHLSAKWQLTPVFAVSTRISNVTDKYYAAHTAGINRVSGDANIATGEKLPGAGREWQLSLQLAF